MERTFFEHVLDAFEGFVDDELGEPKARWHRRGIKVWFGADDKAREHFEAQLIRVDGDYVDAIEPLRRATLTT